MYKTPVKTLLASCLCAFLLSSCGTVQVCMSPKHTAVKEHTIIIEGADDTSGTVGELTHLLYANGFDVLSFRSVAELNKRNQLLTILHPDSLSVLVERQPEAKAESKEITSGDQAEIKSDSKAEGKVKVKCPSDYFMELDYTYAWDNLIQGYGYDSFSARLVDNTNHQVIMTASFRGNRSVKTVLRDFVQKFVDALPSDRTIKYKK